MDEAARSEALARAQAGDAEALQLLIVHYHGHLHRVVQAQLSVDVGGRLDPDDVLQAAYIKVFDAFKDGTFDGPAAFYRWLEAIVSNQARDQERALFRDKRDIRRELPRVQSSASYPDLFHRLAGDDATPSRSLAQNETIAAVMTCLARLPDDQRQVVRWRFLEERPVVEIAAELGRTEGAIHALCHRGLQRLRKLLHAFSRSLQRE